MSSPARDYLKRLIEIVLEIFVTNEGAVLAELHFSISAPTPVIRFRRMERGGGVELDVDGVLGAPRCRYETAAGRHAAALFTLDMIQAVSGVVFDGQKTSVPVRGQQTPYTWYLSHPDPDELDLRYVGIVTINGGNPRSFRHFLDPLVVLPAPPAPFDEPDPFYSSSSSNGSRSSISRRSWEEPPPEAYEAQPRHGDRSRIGRTSAVQSGRTFSFKSGHFTGSGAGVRLKNGVLLTDINLQDTANSGPADPVVYLHKSTAATKNGVRTVTRHGRDPAGLLTTMSSLRRVHGRHPYTRQPFGHSDVRRISQNALRAAVEAEIERRRRAKKRQKR